MRADVLAFGLLAWAALVPACGELESERTLVVGSKVFTESVILGEIVAQDLRSAGFPARHRAELGGTPVLWNALLAGDVDVYPDYTGTLTRELLAELNLRTEADLRQALRARGVGMSAPLGFDNSYALGVRAAVAQRLGLRTLSDLRDHPELRFGFSNEFIDREDGWESLQRAYGLPQTQLSGLAHDLAYRGLEGGDLDATDVYTTDAEITYYDLRVLEDDRHHFPPYEAVLLYRLDVPADAVAVLEGLEGRIDADAMRDMNARAKLENTDESVVAADYLADQLGVSSLLAPESFGARLARLTVEHLRLVVVSLFAALVVALPLGVAAARYRRLGQVILGMVGVIQTIPSLALLVFMIPLLGIGDQPAIVALFLYSLLPIVRNTQTGLVEIPRPLRESAAALGLSAWARLRLVELPMASPHILAGIKTSAVINVGTATLGALIGAGGYGQPILTGIRRDDVGMILQGAIPAAVLALLVQGLFELAERRLVPRGLRIERARRAHG